ncbi:MAG: conjugal transfer protein TraC [Candidatus Ryanbacteria bacterium RIFCSPHIGHO2_02_FULL_45_13b]|uniref:Conjugal transfer protein TraC n=1 Tax=Candidatus Ryanbacteria bacterium RIFCSPHIGHO2_02_FULL_45_13b TaxID=1802117 RepID=A0A1G2G4C9_9BACT|nr:MAG: conjugal transfer protein TraC [Candidatus Ryanbacteria bacterium RIFCSPHIGHO2_02_FULL_45_13b]
MALFKNIFGKKQEDAGNILPVFPQDIYASGLLKLEDAIAPAALKINPSSFQLGEKFTRTLYVYAYPRFLATSWFSPVINLDKVFDIAIYVHPVDTSIILRDLRKKVAEVQSQVSMREEKGFVRDPILDTAYQDLEALRDKLQQATEKLFSVGLYITVYADSEKELSETESEIRSILEAKLIYAKPALFQQQEGFTSTLPLLLDRLEVHTYMNSSPLSSVFPFVSFDLTSNRGILYGINRHNNSLILFDRFTFENYNTVIFGKAGGGKSYLTKLEILRSLMFDADVIVIDPEHEYEYLAETVGGQHFNISINSPHHLNPFDLPIPREDESTADVLRSNIINLIGLFRIMLGGLTPEEDAILDRALTETYAAKDITPDADLSRVSPPILSDLHLVLSNIRGGDTLAMRLYKYVEGTSSGFLNQPTNININKNMVVFSLRDMEDELRPIGMYIVTHYIWNVVRSELKKRILIVDEAWWMMKHEDGASFLFGIVKRARKYFLGVTTITQDIEDFMGSPYGKPIITNSSIQILLKQSPATIDIMKDVFNLTDEEKFMLLESDVGEGIFFAGLKHVAVKIIASYTEDQIITSDPQQLLAIRKAKEEIS